MTPTLAENIRGLVFATAQRYRIPPVLITAHVRHVVADKARRIVMRTLIDRHGFTRQQVANIFDRDRRRVRKSVLEKPDHQKVIVVDHVRRWRCGDTGNGQLAWNFSLRQVESVPRFQPSRHVRPIPEAALSSLDDCQREVLVNHFRAELRKLGKVVVIRRGPGA